MLLLVSRVDDTKSFSIFIDTPFLISLKKPYPGSLCSVLCTAVTLSTQGPLSTNIYDLGPWGDSLQHQSRTT